MPIHSAFECWLLVLGAKEHVIYEEDITHIRDISYLTTAILTIWEVATKINSKSLHCT